MLFIDNKYTKTYYAIIAKAQQRTEQSGYTENHHIIPKSLVSNNNLVTLTAREHFICHWLLTKMVDGSAKYKMGKAFNRMIQPGNKHQARYTPKSGRVFALCRESANKSMRGWKHSAESKKKIGIKSAQKTYSIETRKKMRLASIAAHKNMSLKLKEKQTNMMIRNNPSFNPIVKEKQRAARIAYWEDPIRRNNHKGFKDKTHRDSSKELMRQSKLDMFAKMSIEDKKKLNVVAQTQVKWKCEHCGKTGKGKSNYNRWHGDNCRNKR